MSDFKLTSSVSVAKLTSFTRRQHCPVKITSESFLVSNSWKFSVGKII